MNRNGGPHFSISGSDRGKSRPPRPAFEYVDRMFREDLKAVPEQVREFVRQSLAEVQFRTFGWANQNDYLEECMTDVQALVNQVGPDIERADFNDVFVRFFDIIQETKDAGRRAESLEEQIERDLADIQRERRYEISREVNNRGAHVGRTGHTQPKPIKKF